MTGPDSVYAELDGISAILEIFASHRFLFSAEDELQRGIAGALAAAGLVVEREVRLTQRDRIDLLVGTVGIEVKIAGDASRVERQLERYTQSDLVTALILVTTRVRHRPPPMLNGKPVTTVSLLHNSI